MGLKQQTEIIELLKADCIHSKLLLQEVILLRKDIAEHSKRQEAGLKEWMNADVAHHLSDNGTLAETVKTMDNTIKQMNTFMSRFPYPASLRMVDIVEGAENGLQRQKNAP